MNRESGKTVIVPMDHGVTLGPIPGLTNMARTVQMVVDGGASAILMHKGMVEAGHRGKGKDIGLIIHLTAGTVLSPDANAKVPVCTVEEALMMGADAVSVHVNLGAETDDQMLADLGMISGECRRWMMPLVAMMYARGEKVQNEYDVKVVKHAARVGAELGADLVKVNYTGSVESFREVIEGCSVPVLIAGGEKTETDEEVLEMVAGALAAGAAGASIGRNAFQHKHPDRMVAAISRMVHQGISAPEAKAFLEG